MSKVKGFSKGSTNYSSRGLQTLANYHLKETGKYMTGEELLKTQNQTPNDEEEFTGLQKSDIIQFETEAFDHWGLYIGNNCVAHLTDGVIRQAKLVDVAGGKQCRINNKVKSAAKRELTALNPDKIIETVRKSLNKRREGSGPVTFNSEHQVTEWKYGEAFSDTLDELVRDAGRTGGAVIAGTAGILIAGPFGLTAVPFGYEVGEKIAESLTGSIQAKTNS